MFRRLAPLHSPARSQAVSFTLILACLCCLTLPARAAVEDLEVSDYTQVSVQRVGRGINEYVFTLTVNNPAEPLTNVTATVTSNSNQTQIIENSVVFGDLATGSTVSADTFTFRQNRRFRFNPNNLVWTFTADEPEPNQPPVANAGVDQSVNTGATVTLNGGGSGDPDGDPLTFAWSLQTPSGSTAALSDATAVAPTFVADVAGSYVASLVVNDGEADSAADQATVTALFTGSNAPVINSAPVVNGSLNEAYQYDVNATDPDAGDVLTYSLSLAPAGMNIDPNSGLITWLPNASGAYDVDVRVTDSTGRTDRQIYLLTVDLGNNDAPPTLAPIADQSTVVNETLMVQAVADDPDGLAIRYDLTNAPTGMSIHSATGEILWTPGGQQQGTFSATVTATDPGGQSAQQSFGIEVLAERQNTPPVLAPIANQTVNALNTLQLGLSATDADAGDILRFSLLGAPASLQFDTSTATLSWTPDTTEAGTINLTATVTDSAGDSDSAAFTITVVAPNLPPTAVNDAYTIDRDAQLQIPAEGVLANDTDPNNDVLTAIETRLPDLGSLDFFPGNGAFDYTPPANPAITIGLEQQCRTGQSTVFLHANAAIGDIDADGEPEIVSVALNGTSLFSRRILVLNGVDCSIESNVVVATSDVGALDTATPLALVNLDTDPDLEIVMVRTGPPQGGSEPARLYALNADGSPVWTLPGGASELSSLPVSTAPLYSGRGPTIADLDADGTPEILMAMNPRVVGVGRISMGIVAYNADGTIRWEFTGPDQGGDIDGKPLYVADLDLDGTVEVLYHTSVVHEQNGVPVLKFNLTAPNDPFSVTTSHLSLAIANLDNDPFPEIVGRNNARLFVFEHTGAIKWQLDRPTSTTAEITVGEFDGDPLPEIVYLEGTGNGNNASWLTLFDTDGTVIWTHEGTIFDGSGAGVQLDRGPSAMAFDFDRDGIDEITIVMDALDGGSGLFMFDGTDGSLIDFFDGLGGPVTTQGGSATIADTDGDGAAEIIYVDYTANLNTGYVVLEGTAGNPFPPARPVRHQRMYVPTYVDTAGNTLPYPAPHWLIPGLNKWYAAPVLPFEDPGATDSFAYVANDGAADSNEAEVRIAITNVNAPTIISSPPLGASPNFDYLYGLLATDGDLGDLFTWTLVDAPVNMIVDSFGIVRWTPEESDLGSNRVHVVVTDAQGNTGEQSFVIDVQPPTVVPALNGLEENDAITQIESVGLAVGNVSQGYSFNVPAGQVISQSIAGGADSAAGAFIDIVISIGPRPVFVPELIGLNQAVAQATLDPLALTLGTTTLVNDTAPVGTVIAQDLSPGTSVDINTTVNVTVSGGPALRAQLSRSLLGPSEDLTFTLQWFDNTGLPVAAPGDLQLAVLADPGATGTPPAVNGNTVSTSLDTRGGYLLNISARSLGVALQEPFLVTAALAADGAQAAYADLSAQINRLTSLYADLNQAVIDVDLVALQNLGATLVAERNALDMDALRFTPSNVPETGFLPNGIVGPVSSGDAIFPVVLANMRAPLVETTTFLNNLNPAVARNDDVRNRFLNQRIASELALFDATGLTINASVVNADELHDLLSLVVPELLLADMNRTIATLTAQGLIASTDTQAVSMTTQPAFFTLGGTMSATAFRSKLIKDLYVPIVKKIAFRMQNLVLADLLEDNFAVDNLPGIVTGASLSFNSFSLGHAVVESENAADTADGNIVLMIGPTLLADLAAALNNLSVSFSSVRAAKESFDNIRETADMAQDAVNRNFRQLTPDETANGCVFSVVPGCRQMGFSQGLPTVYTEGSFPAPVLLLHYNAATAKVSIGNFLFFPLSAE